MTIQATCPTCHRTYDAPAELRGKSVRCKDCGNVFVVGRPDPDMPDLSAIEEAFAPAKADTDATGRIGGIDASRARTAGIQPLDEAASPPGLIGKVRPSPLFNYPGAREVDTFLPIVLVAGVFLFVFMALAGGGGGRGEVGITRAIVAIACYAGILTPLALAGLGYAARRLGLNLAGPGYWRALAAFTPALLMSVWLWTIGGEVINLVVGTVVGLLLTVGTLWLLFRLLPTDLAIAAGFGSLGYLGGMFASAALLFVVNLLVMNVTGSGAWLPASPIAMNLPWATPPAPAPPPAPPPLAAPRTIDVPVPAPVNPALDRVLALTYPAKPGLTDDTRPLAVAGDSGPLVQLRSVPIPPATEFTRPGQDAPVLVAFRDGRAQVFSTQTWTPLGPDRPGERTGLNRVIVSPAGRWLSSLAAFPKPAIDTTMVGGGPRRTIVIESVQDRTLLEFVDTDRLVLANKQERRTLLELWDVDAAAQPDAPTRPAATLSLDLALQGDHAIALLPGDRGVVFVGRLGGDDPRAVIGIQLWNTSGPAWQSEVPLDRAFEVRPTGVAVDSSTNQLAVLIEAQAGTVLYAYDRTSDAGPDTFVDRTDRIRRPDNWGAYPSITWVSDRLVLAYGRWLIDAAAEQIVAELNLPGVVGVLPSIGPVVPLIQQQGTASRVVLALLDPLQLDALAVR